jgi:hypothetical protein
MMELRESIEEAIAAKASERVQRMLSETSAAATREATTLSTALATLQLDAARDAALRLRYWQRALDALVAYEH